MMSSVFLRQAPRTAVAVAAAARLSTRTATRMPPGTQLLVCDMAGTTVEEGGAVYRALYESIHSQGVPIEWEEMHDWHGAQKTEVMAHFLGRADLPMSMVDEIEAVFEDKLIEAYFAPDAKLALIDPGLPAFFEECRASGVKVGLNTGYSEKIQAAIVEKLELDRIVDGYVCAAIAGGGRPSPKMVHHLMRELGVSDPATVVKAGDTINDIKEGINAESGLVVGVLSGADSEADLAEAGAHAVIPNVTHLAMPN